MGRTRKPTDREWGRAAGVEQRPERERWGKARARERTAKGKAREMERKEVVKRAENPPNAGALSVGGSTGPPSAPRMLARKEVASPRPESKCDILRKK